MYVTQKSSVDAISKRLNMSKTPIIQFLRQRRVMRPIDAREFTIRICKACNLGFVPTGTVHRICKTCAPVASDYGRWSKYKITRQQYDAMLVASSGFCAICQETMNDKPHGPQIDHCHDTGLIRGLLCSNCNTALGLMGDNAETLQRAAAYLTAGRSPDIVRDSSPNSGCSPCEINPRLESSSM